MENVLGWLETPLIVEEALHIMCEEGFCSSFTLESLMFPINSPSDDEGVTEEKAQLLKKHIYKQAGFGTYSKTKAR